MQVGGGRGAAAVVLPVLRMQHGLLAHYGAVQDPRVGLGMARRGVKMSFELCGHGARGSAQEAWGVGGWRGRRERGKGRGLGLD